jgi:hypothetical protein
MEDTVKETEDHSDISQNAFCETDNFVEQYYKVIINYDL